MNKKTKKLCCVFTGWWTQNRCKIGKRFLILTSLFFLLSSLCLYALEDFIVDDFSAIRKVNNIGGETGTWSINSTDKSQFCNAVFDPIHRIGDKGYCLRLEYDIDSVRTYIKDTSYSDVKFTSKIDKPFTAVNGYYTQLKGADLRKYEYLIFYVKGDINKGFTKRFRVEIEDSENSSGCMVEWINDKWQRMAIPLAGFKEISDWSYIKELRVVFGPQVTEKVGTIYIDNIHFSEKKEKQIEKHFEIVKAAGPILIDGVLKEWEQAEQIEITPMKHLEAGSVTDKDDLSADVWLMWDEEYLYFAANVTDNQVINRMKGPDIWREDCVELFIDPNDNGFIWGNKRDFQIGLSPSGSDAKPQSWAWFQNGSFEDYIEKSVQIEKNGYIIEAAIKWSFLDVRPKKGMVLGVSPAVHDFDEDKSSDGKLNWEYVKKGRWIILGKMVLE